MKTLVLLISWFQFSSAVAQEPPQYIAAHFRISGELTADTSVLLTVGKPAKVEWQSDSDEKPDYALLIPAPTLTEGVPNVFGLLLVKHSGQRWSAISESNSINKDDRLLGLTQQTATIDIETEFTTKEAFIENFKLLKSTEK